MKSESRTLREELESVRRDKAKLETDHKTLQSLSEKRKAAERDLEAMVKDLKEKLDKYDNEKKGAAKVEKARRESVTSKQEQEKK